MRNFNIEEKEILKLIVYDSKKKYELAKDRKRISVYDLLEKMAKDLKVQIDIDRKRKKLVLRSDKFGYRLIDGKKLPIIYENWGEHLHETFYKIEEKIVIILSLLDYLEKNHLIYIFPLDEKKDEPIKLNKDFVFDIPDYIPSYGNFFTVVSNKFDYIYENLFDSIISTPELIEFVKNGFKDKEQIRHEDNIFWQKIAIGVALLLGVVSITDELIKGYFGITNNNNPVELQVSSNKANTVTTEKIQQTGKTSLGNVVSSTKLFTPDTLKK